MNFYVEKIEKIKNKIPKVNINPLQLLKNQFEKWRPVERPPILEIKNVTEN